MQYGIVSHRGSNLFMYVSMFMHRQLCYADLFVIVSDNYIQKTKQRYNNTRTLYTRVDLSQISGELKNSPPHEISETDLGQMGAVISNGSLLSVPPSTTGGK